MMQDPRSQNVVDLAAYRENLDNDYEDRVASMQRTTKYARGGLADGAIEQFAQGGYCVGDEAAWTPLFTEEEHAAMEARHNAANNAPPPDARWVTVLWTVALCALFLIGILALAASYFAAAVAEITRELIK